MRTGQHITLEGRTVTIVRMEKYKHGPAYRPAMIAQFETPEHEPIALPRHSVDCVCYVCIDVKPVVS